MQKTMEDYIREIPQVLKENIENRKVLVRPLTEKLEEKGIRPDKTLVWVASGSSYNAISGALLFMNRCMNCGVKLISPYEFCYYEQIQESNIYIFVSQSGCSTNIVDAIKKYQGMGGRAIAVLGNRDTEIAKLADEVIEYGVGEESVGYVTKGVMTLTCFCMLVAVSNAETYMDMESCHAMLEEMRIAADNHGRVYEAAKEFCRENEKAMLSMEHVMIMGGGANMGTIREGALKLAEMTHVQTTFYEVEEFIHGPNLQLTPQYTLFFVEAGDEGGRRVKDIYRASKEMTDKTFLISASEWGLEKTEEAVSPLYLTAFFQYLAYWTAKELDIRCEHPFYIRFKEFVKNKTADYKEESPF